MEMPVLQVFAPKWLQASWGGHQYTTFHGNPFHSYVIFTTTNVTLRMEEIIRVSRIRRLGTKNFCTKGCNLSSSCWDSLAWTEVEVEVDHWVVSRLYISYILVFVKWELDIFCHSGFVVPEPSIASGSVLCCFLIKGSPTVTRCGQFLHSHSHRKNACVRFKKWTD